jgi:hypothetical protein
MITLTENWKLDSDKHQWILIQSYDGKDKDGLLKRHEKQSYHGTLAQVAKYIVNQEAKAAEQLEYILDIVGNLERAIEGNLIKYVGVKK